MGRGSKQESVASKNERTSFRLGGLDGIRALACIAVLLYHTWPAVMPGGFLGVDVFFVLSGFLITSLLLKDYRQFGKIRLGRFWLRRWRRLFPAVATVVLVSVPIAALIDLNNVAHVRSQVLGSLTFTYNVVEIASGSSYFEQAYPRILTNMWTLAVEQQFYVLWPLILIAIAYIARRQHASRSDSQANLSSGWLSGFRGGVYNWAILVPLTLAVASIALMAVLSSGVGDVTRAYMGTDSHCFGLMLGAALAMFYSNALTPSRYSKDFFRNNFFGFIGWIVFFFVLSTFFWVRDDWAATYPWLTLLVVLGTMFVVSLMTAKYQTGYTLASALRASLDYRPLVWLGERSYGVYLWHWPILVMWWSIAPHAPMWVGTFVVGPASIAAAALSYRYIENPMRYEGIIHTVTKWCAGWRKNAIFIGIAIIFLVGLLVALWLAPGQTDVERALTAASQDDASLSKNTAETKASAPSADTQKQEKAKNNQETTEKKPEIPVSGENITMIGDSVVLAVKDAVQQKWPGAVVDGEVSRSHMPIAGLIDSYKAHNQLRHYVIVGSANNSAIPAEVIEQWLGQIGEDRVLVLITGHGNARTSWIPQSNDVIHKEAQAHPDRIVVADWSALADQHPEYLYGDYTHPNPDGMPAFVDMLSQSLSQAQNLEQ